MALLLPFVIIGGYSYPKIGFTVVGLITLFMILSSQRGRFYCGWLCPMGSLQGVASKNIYLLTVDDSCIECGLSRKVCPVDTYPGSYKIELGSVAVSSVECLRCFNCVNNCPKDSLAFLK